MTDSPVRVAYPISSIVGAEIITSETNTVPMSLDCNDLEIRLSSDTPMGVTSWMDNVGYSANTQIGLGNVHESVASNWFEVAETAFIDPMENMRFTAIAGIGSQDTNSLLAPTAPVPPTEWATSLAPLALGEQRMPNETHESPHITAQTMSKTAISSIKLDEDDGSPNIPTPRNNRLATPISIHLTETFV